MALSHDDSVIPINPDSNELSRYPVFQFNKTIVNIRLLARPHAALVSQFE